MLNILAVLFSILALSSGSVIRTAQSPQNDSQIFCTYREPIGAFGYTCNLNIQNPTGFNNFTSIGGEHVEGFTDADVEIVYISYQNTRNIPSIVCEQFPNVLDLIIGMSQVQVIDRNSFRACTNLEFLLVSSNNIPVIPSDTFSNNPNLQFVMLPDNRIREIGLNVFRGTNVSFLDLDENELSAFHPGWFHGIEEVLNTLILSFNRFTTFPSFGFEELVNLTELDISMNPITNLYVNIFLGLSNLTRLYMSALGLSTINPSWFVPLTSIEHIYLSYNRIRDVPDNSFNSLLNLQTVDLSDNDLTFIRASAFGSSIRNLRFLNLAYNSISAVDEEVLEEAESLMWFLFTRNECFSRNFYNVPDQREQISTDLQQCFTNFIGSARCQFVDMQLFPYECLLFITNPVGNDFETIDGEHAVGRNNSDVLIVETLNQNTRNFPPVICRQFPNVEVIFMEESRIEFLDVDAFVDCQQVEQIVLSFNRITSIPGGLFRNNPSLEVFVAASNLINVIGALAFDGSALEEINLSNNRLGTFNPLPFNTIADTLKYLYLADNGFTTLPSGAFDRLTNLENLDLSSNNFTSIPSNAFRYLSKLEEFRLRDCGLTELDPLWFENLPSLEELKLDRNSLTSIPDGTFSNVRALEEFSIIGNSIRNIHASSFGNLESLEYFYASENGVRSIDREFYDRATELRSLLLEDNICTSQNFFDIIGDREAVRQELSECFRMFDGFLNCNFYESFTYVCVLDLQNVQGRDDFTEVTGEHYENKSDADVMFIEADGQDSRNIPSIICRQFPNIVDIYIQRSFIQVIDENTFEDCGNLEFLRLTENEITSIPDFTFINTPRLYALDLFSNRITSIGTNAFANLQLRMIALEENRLTTIDSRWFTSSAESMNYVFLPYNRLREIPEDAFQNFRNVIIMDIGFNPEIILPSAVFQPMESVSNLFVDQCGITNIDSRWFSGLPELTQLTLSRNRISNLQPGVFDQIPNLRNIDISFNSITNINSDAFGSTLPNLRYLHNGDNPTTAIDSQFFDQAEELINLLLNHNLCVSANFFGIQFNRGFVREQLNPCFDNFEIRVQLFCSYFSIQDRTVCSLTADNPHGHDDFEEILGDAVVAPENVWNVQGGNQNTRIVPRILCDTFTGLNIINIFRSRIQRLTENSFRNCRNLTNIQLMYNQLTTIESGTFSGAVNLQVLEVEGNWIHNIADNAFSGTALNFLFIGYNRLPTINRNMLNGIEGTLTELFVYMNNLRDIPENSFDGLENLEYLDLGGNLGLQLPPNVFRTLRNLLYLYIDANDLGTVNPDWFIGLENLVEVDIDRNNIRSFASGVFSQLPSLATLTISENPLEVLNADIFGDNIRNIRFINAFDCEIDAIDERLLNETESLDLLYLYGNICGSGNFFDVQNTREEIRERLATCFDNFRGSVECHYYRDANDQYSCIFLVNNLAGHDQFTSIPGEHEANVGNDDVLMVQSLYQVTRNVPRVICEQFQNIQEILIEDSRLQSITVDNCPTLQRLILAYNEISSIEAGTFRNNRNLELLDLHFNRILTIADDAFAGSAVAVLHLGLNPLGRFNPAWTKSLNGSLRELRMYESQIPEIVESAFENLRNLEFLDIGLNSRLVVPANAFVTLSNLHSLFLDTCGLRSINPQWFRNLTALRDLHLHSNGLRELPAGAFSDLSMSYLSVRDNRLSTINSDAFGSSISTIEFFYATNNRINSIERSFFDQAVDLDSFYLLNNVCVDQNFREIVGSRDFVSQELSQCFNNFQ